MGNEKLTMEDYLKTVAFFSMACQKFMELKQFEDSLRKMYGDDAEHLSDAIFTELHSMKDLHDALSHMAYDVPDEIK